MPLSPADRILEARERARALVFRLGLSRSDALAAHGVETPAPAEGGTSGASDEGTCRRLLGELAAGGLLRYLVPAPFGGANEAVEVGPVAAIREELAYASGLVDLLFAMQGLGSHAITLAGTEEQKARCLPRIASGSAVAAFAVTEPEAGSDLSAIRMMARREGDEYVLEGTKTFISNAPFADLVTVIAQADPARGRKGLTAFVVERRQAGFSSRGDIELVAPHPIGTLVLSGCRVPARDRLGEEGEGFTIAMITLDRFRATVGAAAVGFARRALDEALRFANERIQFGRPIGEFEGIQFKLADMATRLDAAQLLVTRAAHAIDRAGRSAPARVRPDRTGPERLGIVTGRGTVGAASSGASESPGAGEPVSFPLSPLGEHPSREASMAKLFATEAAQEIVDEAVQIHGARGLVRGSVVESLYREVRALRIYEGTSEIQRTVIGRSLIA